MLLMPPHPYGSQVQAYLAGAVAVPAPWTFPPEGRKPVRHAAQSQVDCLAARESAGSFARNRVLPPHALQVSAPRPHPASSEPHMLQPCPRCQRFGNMRLLMTACKRYVAAGEQRRKGKRDDYQPRFNRFKIVQLPGKPDDMPGAQI